MLSNQFALALLVFMNCVPANPLFAQQRSEPHRPLIHFTPKEKWINDPNGMVYFNGTYHLFYQYYPDSTVWGPMHWGHATSTDLLRWKQQPIALYPDSLGYIFSGSAAADVHNTSGFGRSGRTPLVAVYTSHDPVREKQGRLDFQNQSLAYSLDEGKTWTKYSGNPVLKNPGIRDFRDPKITWYEEGKKWIMTLATQDRVGFFSSVNLKAWKKESEFGKTVGAHGGVWECPDLFPLEVKGKTIWVLLVSINPGGPNGGSATQYFIGHFDGKTFSAFDTATRWIDYGPDDYAGVTWSNTGKRKIFLGWMSNWQYADRVPTKSWRGAMTLPRSLGLVKQRNAYLLTSTPVSELAALAQKQIAVTGSEGVLHGATKLHLRTATNAAFSLTFSNAKGEKLTVGFDSTRNQYFIDRTASGEVHFEKGFAARHAAPRLVSDKVIDMVLVVDVASVELFADGGRTCMTAIFFPSEPYTGFSVQASSKLPVHVDLGSLLSTGSGDQK